MISLWQAYHAKVVHLSALLLTLLFSLASLVSCNQPAPLYTSINLGIPAAALQSPVKGNLPDATELHVGITFKIDPRLLNQADQQRPQPGQPSNPGGIGHGLGIDNGLFVGWGADEVRHCCRPFSTPFPPNPSCTFQCNGLSSIMLYVN